MCKVESQYLNLLVICLDECDVIYRPRRRSKREVKLAAASFGRDLLPQIETLAVSYKDEFMANLGNFLQQAFREHRETSRYYPKPAEIGAILERKARDAHYARLIAQQSLPLNGQKA